MFSKVNQEVSSKVVSLIFGVLVLCFVSGYWVLAWEEPSETAPLSNVPTPLNVATSGQIKEGGLYIDYLGGGDNSLIVGPSMEFIVRSGKVGIKIGERDPLESLEVIGNILADGFCLSGDPPCINSWPEGGGGGWAVPSEHKQSFAHNGNFIGGCEGGQNGWECMNMWIHDNGCPAEDGWHVCDGTELTRWLQSGRSTWIAGNLWYFSGSASDDESCVGWSSGLSGDSGAATKHEMGSAPYTEHFYRQPCNLARGVACCKY